MLRRTALVAGWMALSAAGAQKPARECAEVLGAPTRDSIPLAVAMRTHTTDALSDFPAAYQELFGEGVRQFLVLPKPLTLDTYAAERDVNEVERVVHLTMDLSVRATLRRAGHIENIRVTGGTRYPGFEQAIIASLRALDTSGMLPPVPDSVGLASDTIPIVLTILTNDSRTRLATGVEVPLFEFRTPLFPVSRAPKPLAGNGRLRYPPALRSQGITGDVVLSFVLSAEGVPDMETLLVWKADHRDFLMSVIQALPNFRYQPLEVGGCPVRLIVREPFRFTLGS